MTSIALEDVGKQLAERVRQLRSQGSTTKPWIEQARPEQLRPEGCRKFGLRGGRGSGKTRAGAEDTLERMREIGSSAPIHILAPTHDDVQKVCIEGISGILACARPGEVVDYNKNSLEIKFKNGAYLRGFSGEAPKRLNGPQCGHLWIDEYWAVPKSTIDQALFGLRIGQRTTLTATSTPKPTESTKHVKKIFSDGVLRRIRMEDNRANLSPEFIEEMNRLYGGTRLAKVELEGEEVEDIEGALWQSSLFDREGFRLPAAIQIVEKKLVYKPPPGLVKVVVAIDPTIEDPELKKDPYKEMDACGVCVAGVDEYARGYVLGDFTAIMKPSEWAKLALKLYSLCLANSIICEKNQGGELIRETIKGYGSANIDLVHASMGKRARAEPVSTLYEQGRVHHCGILSDLEDEQTSWNASDPAQRSPNRIDALVWAFHGLGLCNATGLKITSRASKQKEEDDDFQ